MPVGDSEPGTGGIWGVSSTWVLRGAMGSDVGALWY